MDNGGMDPFWIHPKEDDQKVIEETLKRERDALKRQKEIEERRRGDR